MTDKKIVAVLDDFLDYDSSNGNGLVVIITDPLSITFAKLAEVKMETSMNGEVNTLGYVSKIAQKSWLFNSIRKSLVGQNAGKLTDQNLPITSLLEADPATYNFGYSLAKGYWVEFNSKNISYRVYTHRKNQRIIKLLVEGKSLDSAMVGSGLDYRKIKFYILVGILVLVIIFIFLNTYFSDKIVFLNGIGESFNRLNDWIMTKF